MGRRGIRPGLRAGIALCQNVLAICAATLSADHFLLMFMNKRRFLSRLDAMTANYAFCFKT